MQSTGSLEELIKSHPFLAGLDPRFLSFLETCASVRRFGSQQRIFQEGGEADHFYLIVEGKVTLDTVLADGSVLPVQTLGAGEALGLSWMFPPYLWCFTAATAAPTEALSFGAELLRQKAQADPRFGNELLTRITRTLMQRLHVTRRALVQLSASSLRRQACREPANGAGR